MNQLKVKDIKQLDDRTLQITWTDNKISNYDVVTLRRKCPCAMCVDEWTHKPILKPDKVSDQVRPKLIKSVGRYALTIHFNDGHSTGIYPYELLRQL